MRPLTTVELLSVWEQGIDQPLLARSLHLLGLACPEMDTAAVAKMSIGERDLRLLQLREWMFGRRLANMARCPRCREYLEWEINIDDMRLSFSKQKKQKQELYLEVDDYRIRFRLPNSTDIHQVIAENTGPVQALKILSRCISDCQHRGKSCDPSDLPDNLWQAISRRMEEEEPQADICMALQCPNCSHQWEARFDIVNYLWIEINRWAECLLVDIHRLAKAYGWSEHDILQMSPLRRYMYLGMVKG